MNLTLRTLTFLESQSMRLRVRSHWIVDLVSICERQAVSRNWNAHSAAFLTVAIFAMLLSAGHLVPAVFAANPGKPIVTLLNPNNAQQGQTLDVAITGGSTHFAQGSSSADFGTGVKINSVKVIDESNAIANITVDPGAATGNHSVSITTGNETASISTGFTVNGGTDAVAIVTPNLVNPAQASTAVPRSPADTTVSPQQQQQLGAATPNSAATASTASTQGKSPSSTAASAPANPNSAATASSTSTQVKSPSSAAAEAPASPSGNPSITSLSPNSGAIGQKFSVVITGANTNFVQGQTLAKFGPGISVGGSPMGDFGRVTVNSSMSATAQLLILAPARQRAPHDVTVITGTEKASLAQGFTVFPTQEGPPVITDFNPKSAPVGTLITVSGNNLVTHNGAGPQVTLQQQGGGTISAPVSSYTNTALSFVVPTAAATGTITVTVGTQSVVSAASLTITTSSSFTLTAAPSPLSLIQGQSAAYSVNISSNNGFNQLASLSVSGLPSGVTASFSPTQITAGQTSVVTLSAQANQALGTSNLSFTATATISGQVSPSPPTRCFKLWG